MAFLPPINMGSFKPSPATLAQWVYDIWNYLQENPIATQEDITTYIQNYFETSPEVQEIVGEVVAQYLLDNPPQAPVQSVQGKTGAVNLTYPDIVPASNAVPVYRAASAPNTSTAQGLYNNGYRLFVNTATQEIYTISNAGALSLVGRGKFDGTTVDLNTSEGDTTIAEAITDLQLSISNIDIQVNVTIKTLAGITLNANSGRVVDVSIAGVSGYTLAGNVACFVNGVAGVIANLSDQVYFNSMSPKVYIYNTADNQVTFSNDSRVIVVSIFKRISTP